MNRGSISLLIFVESNHPSNSNCFICILPTRNKIVILNICPYICGVWTIYIFWEVSVYMQNHQICTPVFVEIAVAAKASTQSVGAFLFYYV